MAAIDAKSLKTGFQEVAEKSNVLQMIGEELKRRGVSAGLSIKPVVGQTVSFTEGGKKLAGKILEVLGGRVKIDMGGKIVVASIEQLTSAVVGEVAKAAPTADPLTEEAKKYKTAEEFVEDVLDDKAV